MPFSSSTGISSTSPLATSTPSTLPLLLTRPLRAEHRWPPETQPKRSTMSVSLHSLADAALADASERPPGHSRSRSYALPPISALLNPDVDSQNAAPHSRPQTPTRQPLTKGWTQPSSDPSQAQPGVSTAFHPTFDSRLPNLKDQALASQVPVEQAPLPLEYNVRRYKRGESVRPNQPPSQTTRRHTAPVIPTTTISHPTSSCSGQAKSHSSRTKKEYPLQNVQLDKHYPELSIHGWHEDARRLLQPPRAFSPSCDQREQSAVKRSASQASYPFTPTDAGTPLRVRHPRPCWPEPLPQLLYSYAPCHPYQPTPQHVPIIAEPRPRPRQKSYRFISQKEKLANAAKTAPMQVSKSCFGIGNSAGRLEERKRVPASAPVSPRHQGRPLLATAVSSIPLTPVSSHDQNPYTRHASPRPVSPARSTMSSASTILPIDGEPGLDLSSASSYSGSEPYSGTDMDHDESDSGGESDMQAMGGKPRRGSQKMISPNSCSSTPAKRLLDSSQQGSTPSSSFTSKRQRTCNSSKSEGMVGADGKPVKRLQGRNKEKRREQNAVAQKKFRWKKKQLTEKMATDLESAHATIKDLEQRLEDSQGLVSKLKSELHVSQHDV
ncbi:hypothetical protein IAR50_002305 [Cryptococcus sp. DSM 104548]